MKKNYELLTLREWCAKMSKPLPIGNTSFYYFDIDNIEDDLKQFDERIWKMVYQKKI